MQCEVVCVCVGGCSGVPLLAMKCDQISKAFTVAVNLYICISKSEVAKGGWERQEGMGKQGWEMAVLFGLF